MVNVGVRFRVYCLSQRENFKFLRRPYLVLMGAFSSLVLVGYLDELYNEN